jgi:hypothetical protein
VNLRCEGCLAYLLSDHLRNSAIRVKTYLRVSICTISMQMVTKVDIQVYFIAWIKLFSNIWQVLSVTQVRYASSSHRIMGRVVLLLFKIEWFPSAAVDDPRATLYWL